MRRALRKAAPSIVLALGLLSCGLAGPADARGSSPYTLGVVDTSFLWTPPTPVVESILKCAYQVGKAAGYSATSAAPGSESPIQSCLLQKMREHGASHNAIAFAKWYYDTPYGDSAYITALAKPQYGPVQLASIYYPGRANNNSAYLFVNGTNPRVADPAVAFAPAAQPWKHDARYQAILSAHPRAMVYPALSFVALAKRDGGGQRFTLAAPILDGCHACARLGTVELAYDFGNLGSPKGLSLVSVRQGSTP